MTTIVPHKPAHGRPVQLMLAAAAISAAAFAGSLLSADRATAGQDPHYPWCVEGPQYPLDCGWATYEACEMTAVGVGRCFANPFYQGPKAGAAPKVKRKSRRT
jgi:hypothetical protein